MSCAFQDSVNVETTIRISRLPNPSAATGHVLNRTRTSAVTHAVGQESLVSRDMRHPVQRGEHEINGRASRRALMTLPHILAHDSSIHGMGLQPSPLCTRSTERPGVTETPCHNHST